MKVRTRFAPSPTGYMHIGNLRTALFTWLFARKNKGTFILRIEDTDQNRFVEGAVDMVYSSFKKAGFDWDEGPDVGGDYGPYVQSERKDMYLPFAKRLVDEGKAYYCFCSKERLAALRSEKEADGGAFKYDKHCVSLLKEEAQNRIAQGEEYVIRQNIPEGVKASFDDAIFGHIVVDSAELDDGILIKSDGMPTYNFANVIDDHLMDITHVMRGSEYLSSTSKYNLLYESFGWEKPVYIHLSPIMADSRHKLSKRNGDASFEDLIFEGFLKEAILNYIALLGWSPGDNREVMTMDELITSFNLKGLSKSGAIYDKKKLTWFNGEYIKAMDLKDFHAEILPYMKKMINTDKFDTMFLAQLLQPRCEILPDIMNKIGFLSEMPDYDIGMYFHKRMKTNAENSLPVLVDTREVLAKLEDWSVEGIRGALADYIAEKELKNGKVLFPVRVAISGVQSTPGGAYEIAVLLGKEETLKRFDVSIKKIQKSI